jgi:prepilin-type N-terminal cleavage/methylation domain-containing protein
MKKAFTLIELLVVIAIIAILAAILFPVFAQAKAAAKKTAALSNQKQIGTSIQIYMADYDDMFPRNDGCQQFSSLNAALNVPGAVTGDGCSGAGPYPYRLNHYAWQKWVLPYTKNIQLFEHPGRQKIDQGTPRQWSTNGQLMGGMALNLALTGALNTFPNPNAVRAFRNSWRGGNQNSLPDVSRAMLLFEFSNPTINFAPVVTTTLDDTQNAQIVYPMAIREFWASNFRKTDASCNDLGVNDDARVFAGVIVVGFADGSAKSIPVGQWLSQTPTAAEYGLSLPSSIKCGVSSGTFFGNPLPNLNINYPFWGLSN